MNRVRGIVLIVFLTSAGQLLAQATNSPRPATTPSKDSKTEKSPAGNTNPLLNGVKGVSNNGPVTTEIDADNAFFDSSKNLGIFSGRVKVTDPRFNLQSDKLTVYITKGENQGLEKAIAEGNVAVVRDRPDPNGGPPTRAIGRCDQATYLATTGDVELRGSPRVQEGVNAHIATSPDTVMVVNQNGQLTTRGPSRTEIRQEPTSEEQKNAPKPSASPKGSSTP